MTDRYRIEPIRRDHQRAGFDSGHPFLDAYLARFARQNDFKGVARAYVAVPVEAGNPVAGYYTISAGELAFQKVPAGIRRRLPEYPLPIARIGELAVDRRHQGRGLGAALLVDALKRILNASREVAVWAVVVDPIDIQAAAFYQHFGFEPLFDDDVLFLPISEVSAWLEG